MSPGLVCTIASIRPTDVVTPSASRREDVDVCLHHAQVLRSDARGLQGRPERRPPPTSRPDGQDLRVIRDDDGVPREGRRRDARPRRRGGGSTRAPWRKIVRGVGRFREPVRSLDSIRRIEDVDEVEGRRGRPCASATWGCARSASLVVRSRATLSLSIQPWTVRGLNDVEGVNSTLHGPADD